MKNALFSCIAAALLALCPFSGHAQTTTPVPFEFIGKKIYRSGERIRSFDQMGKIIANGQDARTKSLFGTAKLFHGIGVTGYVGFFGFLGWSLVTNVRRAKAIDDGDWRLADKLEKQALGQQLIAIGFGSVGLTFTLMGGSKFRKTARAYNEAIRK